MVTMSFFSHAFSYTTLMGSSPPPVFSQMVMLLLAIKSSRAGLEQAKSNRTWNIFILSHGSDGILASWCVKRKCTRDILITFFEFVNFVDSLFVIWISARICACICNTAAVIIYRGRRIKKFRVGLVKNTNIRIFFEIFRGFSDIFRRI